MLCFIALFVFLVLSIFSAKYRPLARRAIECVVKKATLRPCDTGLDEELKAKSIAGIMKLSPPAASFVNRHFEAFSFLMTLMFFASLFFAAQGFYNFVIYGNCNGPLGGFCVYSGLQNAAFLKAPTTYDGVTIGNQSAKIIVFEFGCYTCPYTKEAESMIQRTLSDHKNEIYYIYKAFPLPGHPYSKEAVIAASCANEAGKYWEYRAALFENQQAVHDNGVPELQKIAGDLGISNFDECFSSGRYNKFVEESSQECADSGIYGTPTFFVSGKAFVGQTAANDTRAEIERLIASG